MSWASHGNQAMTTSGQLFVSWPGEGVLDMSCSKLSVWVETYLLLDKTSVLAMEQKVDSIERRNLFHPVVAQSILPPLTTNLKGFWAQRRTS